MARGTRIGKATLAAAAVAVVFFTLGVLKRRAGPAPDVPPPPLTGERVEFLSPEEIGYPAKKEPRIASLTVTDLDRDQRADLLVCDLNSGRVGWIRRTAEGGFRETWISPPLPAPARADTCDLDGDGDPDVVVAVLGQLFPSNDPIGQVVWLRNDGRQRFTPEVLLSEVARVSDVRGADLDGDGDTDLAVTQFGLLEGETRWMENLGEGRFRSHILQSLPGGIHIIPEDMDADGDKDPVAIISQDTESIYVFQNDGGGRFAERRIWSTTNPDYGLSGMRVVDFDQDGDPDILFTNGDSLDTTPPRPRPWHGIQWLENRGGLTFRYRRLADFPGASAAVAADVDADGDLDVVASTVYNFWDRPESLSMIWLENDGLLRFTKRSIANRPPLLIALEAANMDDDGYVDFVTGKLTIFEPYEASHRVVLWLNHWGRRVRNEE